MTTRFRVLGASVLFSACWGESPVGNQDSQQPSRSSGVLVSNAAPMPGSPGKTVAWVALQPGTAADGASAMVRSLHGSAEVIMLGGGFDPVPVEAIAGDRVRITVYDAYSQLLSELGDVVEVKGPPIVVRTSPPARKRDVPLNPRILVVFSEPMDPGSLTPQTVRLLRGNVAVPGQIQVLEEGLKVELVPAAPLVPNTEYVLLVTSGVTDLSGNPLAQELRVPFTTGTSKDESWALAFERLGRLAIATADGEQVREFPVDVIDRPAWSPDGRLAVVCHGGSICIMDTLGGDPVQVTPTFNGYHDIPAWDPSGRTLAFFTFDCSVPQPPWDYGCPESGLSLLDTRTLVLTTVPFGDGVGASWSPDGSTIAFACTGPTTPPYVSFDICIMKPDGSEVRHLTSSPEHEWAPAWSPDGTRIAFQISHDLTHNVEHPYEIVVMDADGSNLRRVGPPDGGQFPSWSPDGTRIVFTGYRSQSGLTGGLAVMNADGSGRKWITNGIDGHPAWRR